MADVMLQTYRRSVNLQVMLHKMQNYDTNIHYRILCCNWNTSGLGQWCKPTSIGRDWQEHFFPTFQMLSCSDTLQEDLRSLLLTACRFRDKGKKWAQPERQQKPLTIQA